MSQVTSATLTSGLSQVLSGSRVYTAVMFGLGLLSAIGVAFGLHAFIAGHEHVYGVTREVPWGLLIASYVFFVVTSTGLCLVSSLAHVFKFKAFEPIAQRAVFLAIATIVSGFLVISFEIENPWRMAIYNVISPNLSSNIWWMGTLYGAYLFFMLTEFVLMTRGLHRAAGIVGLAGVLSGIAAHSNLGAVFGLLSAREFWHGPYMPIYFITSAAMSGCAAVLFFTWLGYRANGWKMDDELKKAFRATAILGAFLMAVIMFFVSWKVLSGIAGNPPGKFEAMMVLLRGEYAPAFWMGEILLGLVAPFAIILATKGKSTKWLFAAGALSMIGIFFMRYDLVVVGQLVPHFHELGITGQGHIFSYAPSLHEIMITLGGMSFCGFLFMAGERLFRGHTSSHSSH